MSCFKSQQRLPQGQWFQVVGGSQGQLITQFLGESVLLSLIALTLSLVLVEVFLPAFRNLAGKEVSFDYWAEPQLLLTMLAVALVVGLLAGSYPAFFLSAAQPVQVLKGRRGMRFGGIWFRRGLVVFQFVLSIALIIGTLVTYQQHHFLITRSLGFDKEHLVSVPLYLLSDRARNYELFKQELLKDPHILQITVSSNKPGVTDNNGLLIRAAGADKETVFGVIYVDPDYVQTLKLELVAGRDFSDDIASDTQRLAIAVACLGLFGLATSMAERRTKEIGIRKVLGASIPSFVAMLSKEFTYLVLAANLIASPIAWYAMNRWLESFAYRIELGLGVFVLGGALALVIAWLTVSYQALRAAMANSVEALRYE